MSNESKDDQPEAPTSSDLLSDEQLLEKPHSDRTLEERVRCCELIIAKLCQYNAANAEALRAAWMQVPLG